MLIKAPILCSATVDWVRLGESRGLPFNRNKWRVTVLGRPPYAKTRIYDIIARSDDEAAREGMLMFTADMEGEDDAAGPRSQLEHPTA